MPRRVLRSMRSTWVLLPASIVLVLAVVAVVFIALVQAQDPGVKMALARVGPDEEVAPGGTVDYNVQVDPNGVGGIAGAQFFIRVDPAVLEAESVIHISTPLTNASPVLIKPAAGTAQFAAFTFTPLAAGQALFDFATIRFRVKAGAPPGLTNVVFEFDRDRKTSVTDTEPKELLEKRVDFLGAQVSVSGGPGVKMALVRVGPDDDVPQGTNVDYNVRVDPNGVAGIAGAQLFIRVDTGDLDIVSVTAVRTVLDFSFPAVIKPADGTAQFAAAVLTPPEGLPADQVPFDFATIRFRAKSGAAIGLTDVVFEFEAAGKTSVTDPDGGELLQQRTDFLGATIDISELLVWTGDLTVSAVGRIVDPFPAGPPLVFGVQPDATFGFDPGIDHPTPPAPPSPDYIRPHFFYPANVTGQTQLQTSMIPSTADPAEWPLRVHVEYSSSPNPYEAIVTIMWDIADIPAQMRVLLLNDERQVVTDMRAVGQYEFALTIPANLPSAFRDFTVVALTTVDDQVDPPVLTSPIGGEVVGTTRPEFQWTHPGDPAAPLAFALELTGDAQSGSLHLLIPELDGPSYIHPDDLPVGSGLTGDYEWRVTVTDGVGNTSTSAVGSFSIDLNIPVIELVFPLDGQDVLAPEDADRFEWKPAEFTPFVAASFPGIEAIVPAFYDLQVAADGDFDNPLVDLPDIAHAGPADAGQIHTLAGPLADGEYQWRVRGKKDDLIGEYATAAFRVDLNAPGQPTLRLPVNNDNISDPTPTFDWDDVEDIIGVTYELQYDISQSFINPVSVPDLPTSEFTPAAPLDDGPYFWRVQAFDGVGRASGFSEPFSFTLVAIVLSPPVLIAPDRFALLTADTPFFDWDPPAEGVATGYQLQVTSGDIEAGPYAIDEPVDGNTTEYQTAEDQALSDGIYRWRVIARAGDAEAVSDERIFGVTSGVAPPDVVINEWLAELTVTGDKAGAPLVGLLSPLQFGIHPDALPGEDGFDEDPPPPAQGQDLFPFFVYPENPNFKQLITSRIPPPAGIRDFLKWPLFIQVALPGPVLDAEGLDVEIHISWDIDSIPSNFVTALLIDPTSSPANEVVNMGEANRYSFTVHVPQLGTSSTRFLTIAVNKSHVQAMRLLDQWNMVSLSVQPDSPQPADIFTDITVGTIWRFDAGDPTVPPENRVRGYRRATDLAAPVIPGVGFWVKVIGDSLQLTPGDPIQENARGSGP